MSDLIRREGALAKIRTRLQDWAAYGNEEYRRGLYACEDMILSLSSAEPNKTMKGSDLISRADAIDAVWKIVPVETEIDSTLLDKAEVIVELSVLPSAEAVPQLNQTDTLIIADALRYLAKDTERYLSDRTRADALRQQFLKYGASMCKGGDDE